MAKFTCTSIKPLMDLDKTMARKPTQKLILCNINNRELIKNSSCVALKKQRKSSASIIREGYLLNDILGRGKIMAIMRPNGSDEILVFTRKASHKDYRSSPLFICSLIPYLPLLTIQGLNFQNHAAVTVVMTSTAAILMKLMQIPKYCKWVINLFKGTKKRVKEKSEEINKPKKTLWTFTSEDLLLTPDAYRIEYFVYNIGILLAWWVLSRLISFVHRFYSKNTVRK